MDGELRVCVHFHPDRLVLGEPILERIGREGVYRSQFETGHSNGGLTAHPGGDRWRWESRIFGGAYDDAPAHERPKYGALNFRGSGYGASPRFGSSHLRLNAGTLRRTTFCYPDSVYNPDHFGTADRMPLIPLAAARRDDPLDEYIEAHVHGPILLPRDVEALVLDPCYRGTDIERQAETLGCPVEWHSGFTLSTEVLCAFPEYRGRQFVALGVTLAHAGVLTPRLIGDASRRGEHDEQSLKRVWHYLARFGAETTFQR
ncbi:MAG: DUF3626 domain-containing protein [Tepidisphaera sp.]